MTDLHHQRVSGSGSGCGGRGGFLFLAAGHQGHGGGQHGQFQFGTHEKNSFGARAAK